MKLKKLSKELFKEKKVKKPIKYEEFIKRILKEDKELYVPFDEAPPVSISTNYSISENERDSLIVTLQISNRSEEPVAVVGGYLGQKEPFTKIEEIYGLETKTYGDYTAISCMDIPAKETREIRYKMKVLKKPSEDYLFTISLHIAFLDEKDKLKIFLKSAGSMKMGYLLDAYDITPSSEA